ncbi:MAG TPA: AraC family transcriptional regulator [Rhizobiaceae bacterium]|nr:AraC family transcriptional regulator [Rhizobiaceae bacterium]
MPLRLTRYRPELAGMVEEIIGYRENGRGIDNDVEAAALVVPLVISLGDRFRIGLGQAPRADERYGSFTSGLFAGPVVIGSTGRAECLQVNFTPFGAWRFFGRPMEELANRMVTLEDLDDPELVEFRQRLWEEPDWERRLGTAEHFIVGRLRRTSLADPTLVWAFRHMLAKRGNVQIADIAEKLDCSRKHLSQRFRLQFGLPPKVVARMIRFQAVLAMARSRDIPDWADIAAACGYADQPHLTRDFSEFAGMSPTNWRAKVV